jgi:hypothetical protein
MTIEEVIDGLTVELTDHPSVNKQLRLADPNDIARICPGLVTVARETNYSQYVENEFTGTLFVRLAHFSVQEYLESDRIRHQAAAAFSLQPLTAYTTLAQICLAYFLDRQFLDRAKTATDLNEFLLALYAARNWYIHFRNSEENNKYNDLLLIDLLTSGVCETWIRVSDPERPWRVPDMARSHASIATPLYYTALLGLHTPIQKLLRMQQDAMLQGKKADTKAPCRKYGNALQAALYGGYDKVIQLLLDQGTDVNAKGGEYGNVLQAALYRGYEKVVQLLLDQGAEVDAEGTTEGRDEIVSILVGKASAQGGIFLSTSQTPEYPGKAGEVQALLELTGAAYAERADRYMTPLHRAVQGRHLGVVNQLLAMNANVRKRSNDGSTPLHIGAYSRHLQVVNRLLEIKDNTAE